MAVLLKAILFVIAAQISLEAQAERNLGIVLVRLHLIIVSLPERGVLG